MRRAFLLVWSLAAIFPVHSNARLFAAHIPVVKLSLPADTPSESVQIRYFMSGPFGGYGESTSPPPNVSTYVIEGVVGDEIATDMRILVYVPGCKIKAFTIDLAPDAIIEKKCECQKLPTVRLSGQIVPAEASAGDAPKIAISYVAAWSHSYFGISDGPVTEFSLAVVSPSDQGWFEVEVPDFSEDFQGTSWRKDAFLHLQLIGSASSTPASLRPVESEFAAFVDCLKILPFYPSGLTFTPQKIE